MDLEVGIHKDSETVEVRLKNIIKNLKCKKNIFSIISINTNEDYVEPIMNFFQRRERRL